MKSSKSWASTGISSIWSGCSSSPCSTCGETSHDDSKLLRSRPTGTSDQALPPGLVLAVCSEHMLLSRRLFRAAWLFTMESDPVVHDREGRLDRRRVHAHGVGTASLDLRYTGAARRG